MWWTRWREERILRRHAIPEDAWRRVLDGYAFVGDLDEAGRQRLRCLATLFLYRKTLTPARDLRMDDFMRAAVAAQACLPVLSLGLAYLDGFRQVIVYPAAFLVERDESDEAGVIHRARHEFSGEAWEAGPVLLAWEDIAPGAEPHGEGTSVVIHEIAHKIDMLADGPNGMPPLHPDMSPAEWSEVFSRAYETLCVEVDAGRPTWIDPYAAEAPEEFFAVLSEHFFVAPCDTRAEAPEVYAQLARFYRQDPSARCPRCRAGAPA